MASSTLSIMGLSPRLRGNLEGHYRTCTSYGSIPAPAGEPQRDRCERRPRGVYPRACGGTIVDEFARKSGPIRSIPAPAGEPARHGLQRPMRSRGSIPAPAGEPTVANFRPNLLKRVYPRACGGTPSSSLKWAYQSGLSPRLRGNRRRSPGALLQVRSIPAPAGEPCFFGPTCGS